jgi:phosphopantothenoylcysteine decarboxylase
VHYCSLPADYSLALLTIYTVIVKQTCVARAWDFSTPKPFIVAPAMNTHMWMHPLTERHLAVLHSMGVTVVPPVSKTLACGDVGVGGLAAVADVCAAVQACMLQMQ